VGVALEPSLNGHSGERGGANGRILCFVHVGEANPEALSTALVTRTNASAGERLLSARLDRSNDCVLSQSSTVRKASLDDVTETNQEVVTSGVTS